MPDEEKRYIAVNEDGEAIVAFETRPDLDSDHFQFGVGVYGKICGVHGVGGPQAIKDLRDGKPVLGMSHQMTDRITRPSFSNGVGVSGFGELRGVHGQGYGTGVFGEGLKMYGGGVRGNGWVGVDGSNGDREFELEDGTIVKEPPGVGVKGLSIHGIGVFGETFYNRGGVFGRDNFSREPVQVWKMYPPVDGPVVPQISLIPEPFDGNLPKDGVAGDILVIMPYSDGLPGAELWLCLRSIDPSSGTGALWGKVQMEQQVQTQL